MQLEQNANVLKVKNECLLQEKEQTSTRLQDSEKQFSSRIGDVLKACNNVESSLTSVSFFSLWYAGTAKILSYWVQAFISPGKLAGVLRVYIYIYCINLIAELGASKP